VSYETPCSLGQLFDMGKIRAVFINEGITMFRVIYYLALVIEGSNQLIVIFKVMHEVFGRHHCPVTRLGLRQL